MLQPTFLFIVVIRAWSANGLDDCGTIGSSVYQIDESPWLVSVLQNDNHVCSGVIYSEKFILTAAECVKDLKISDLTVAVGSNLRNVGGWVTPVCKRLIHEQASKKTYDSNLALLGLCDPLQLSESVKKIKAIDKAPEDNAEVSAFGWSSIDLSNRITKRTWAECWLILRRAKVHVYNVTSCAEDRRKRFHLGAKQITELNICTSKPDKICSYEMGSPLISDNRLVGILVKGDCSKKPDVFTSVANHKEWLRSNTKE